jgi:choline dehydrogenase-like flavoprotein
MLYIGDASIFPNPAGKTPAMPIIAFAMRTCDHMLRNVKQGIHKRAWEVTIVIAIGETYLQVRR